MTGLGTELQIWCCLIRSILIDTSKMYEQLTLLTSKLRLQYKGLLLTDRTQVWEMDTSYLLYSNYSIVIFVHLPVGRLGEDVLGGVSADPVEIGK